ncbi:hypothetical protein COF64_19745 [Bacillus sp. AFS043905]|nr:hypothetical protein COF64_19745 [Bacillus sp. AFS043905]
MMEYISAWRQIREFTFTYSFFVVCPFGRLFPFQALAFRGRSGEPPRLAPAGSPLEALFPQESRTPAPINFDIRFS